MTKGFLLIDQFMNTVIVPIGDDDLNDWMKYKVNLKQAHQHKTLKDLDKDVRAYLNNMYEESDRDD